MKSLRRTCALLVSGLIFSCVESEFAPLTSDPNSDDANPKKIQHIVALTTTEQEEKINFSQPERNNIVTITARTADVMHIQSSGGTITESIKQTGREKRNRTDFNDAIVNVGIVIDDSDSISNEELETIANAMHDHLLTSLAGSKYKIAVTGTSKDGTCLLGALSPNDTNEDLKGLLKDAKKQKKGKHWHEVALRKARELFNKCGTWKRDKPDAELLIITNDEDMMCWNDKNNEFTFSCGNAKSFRKSFPSTKQENRKTVVRAVYGILNLSDNTTCGANDNCRKCENGTLKTEIGSKRNAADCMYDKDQEYTLQSSYGSCTGNRGGILNACYNRGDSHRIQNQGWLSTCASSNIQRCYTTDNNDYKKPTDKNAHYLFDLISNINNSATNKYVDIFKAISENVKQRVTEIVIPAVPYIDSIALPYDESEINSIVSVKIGSKTLAKTQYTLSGRNLTLNYSNPNALKDLFPSGSWLRVNYKLKSPNKAFALPAAQAGEVLVVSSVTAHLNDNNNTESISQVDLGSKSVTLNTAPKNGSKVTVTAAFLQTGYQVAQQLHRLTDDITVCSNSTSGTSIACEHVDNQLNFTDPNQISAGDKITVTQRIDINKVEADNLQVQLQENFVPDSIQLHLAGATCDHTQLLRDFNVIMLSQSNNCEPLSSLATNTNQEIKIVYKVYNTQDTFYLSIPQNIGSKEWAIKVYVKDQLKEINTDYTLDRENRTLTYLKMHELSFDEEIKVNFH